jgi:GT2 family glycosyltransferase
MAKVLVIVVNYRVGDLVVECLRSLERERATLAGGRVVVVDNDSQDGSAGKIAAAIEREGWGAWARLVEAGGNIGFAAGNNVGYKAGREWLGEQRPEYIFFLNPDTYLRERAIRILAEFLDTHPEVGIVGGRSEDPDGTPQHCCFRFLNLCNEFASNAQLGVFDRLLRHKIARVPISDEPHEIGWVSGAAMMVRTEIIEKQGLFDEKFFLYYEETDFILRAFRAGWTCWHVPQARIVHLVGYSSGVTVRHKRPGRKPGYWFESRRRFYVKNHGAWYAAAADVAAVSGLILGTLKRIVTLRKNNDPPRLLWDFIRNSVFLKGVRTS